MRQRPDQLRGLLTSEHRDHTRHRLGSGAVDRLDPSPRHTAAHQRRMAHPRQGHVINKAGPTREQRIPVSPPRMALSLVA